MAILLNPVKFCKPCFAVGLAAEINLYTHSKSGHAGATNSARRRCQTIINFTALASGENISYYNVIWPRISANRRCRMSFAMWTYFNTTFTKRNTERTQLRRNAV